ncbi:MAG: alpha/beta fold hydrolase [Burkholderiales bacterium]|nr:alpha/beta fold hydrolase [Burkholderiales bacterium]
MPAPRWLPGGHLQTIWPALVGRRRLAGALHYLRERWETPDGDFVDVDFALAAAPDGVPEPAGAADAAPTARAGGRVELGARPLLVLFHGLEGSSSSHYAIAFALAARERGWDFALPHFRGCSGELNRAPRAYHSGDFEEVGWMLARLRARAGAPLRAVGVSLGGNALLRWAAEAGASAAAVVAALAAVSAPVDLAASGAALGRGFARHVYARMFLRTMRPKALAKWAQHPGLFERDRVARARTLHEFDDAFTAPLHGFAGADDYWARASSAPHLARIGVPALVLNARNDPFVPPSSLPRPGSVGPCVELWQPAHGGHVGFAHGGFPGRLDALPQAVCGWLAAHA